MRTAALLLLTLILSLPARAQDAEQDSVDTIPIVAYWQEGEERIIELVQGTRKFESNSLTSADSTTTVYRVKVLSETDTSYTIRWMAEEFESSTNTTSGLTFADSLTSIVCRDGIIIETNELGTLQRIANLDDLIALGQNAMDQVFEKQAQTPEQREQLAETRELMRSPAMLEVLLTDPIKLFYQMHGLAYFADSTQWYDDSLPSGLGGDPIPARGSVRAEWIDDETSYLLNTVDTDPDAAKSYAMAVLRRMNLLKDGEPLPDELKDARMLQHDQNEYVFDMPSGWLLQFDRVRKTSFLDSRTEKFLRFTLLE